MTVEVDCTCVVNSPKCMKFSSKSNSSYSLGKSCCNKEPICKPESARRERCLPGSSETANISTAVVGSSEKRHDLQDCHF